MAREPTRSASRSQGDEHLAGALARSVSWLAEARWFAGKERVIAETAPADAVAVPGADGALLVLAAVGYADGTGERYAVPARLAGDELAPAGPSDPVWPALTRLVVSGGELAGRHGRFVADPGGGDAVAGGAARLLTEDQSNTSVVLDDAVVVKLYRRLERGRHPEPELLAGLAGRSGAPAPAWRGTLRYAGPEGEETIAVLYEYVPGEPVGWEGIVADLAAAFATDDDAALEALGENAARLGATTARLHRSLREVFGTTRAGVERVAEDVEEALSVLARASETGIVPALGDAAGRDEAEQRLGGLVRLEGGELQRVHGDLHVAQFVASPAGLVVVDFEGTPGRSLEARRRPTSPLRDLAGLLLSLDHAALAAARRCELAPASAFAWARAARARALDAYEETAGEPVDRPLLAALEIERECREVIYAATVLPAWSYAPRLTLEQLLGGRAP